MVFQGGQALLVNHGLQEEDADGESLVGAQYIAAMLLTNLRNFVYPNSISQYFL